jgi:predicted ATPase
MAYTKKGKKIEEQKRLDRFIEALEDLQRTETLIETSGTNFDYEHVLKFQREALREAYNHHSDYFRFAAVTLPTYKRHAQAALLQSGAFGTFFRFLTRENVSGFYFL